MLQPARKLAFVLASSNHGAMIVNRLDYRTDNSGRGDGVGFKILDDGRKVRVAKATGEVIES